MDINKNNYEAFLLDLVEGKLNAEEARQVRDFLLQNPDCAEGMEEMQPMVLESEMIPCPLKAVFKKEFPLPGSALAGHNFDMFSIARMEGDLTPGQIEEYDHLIGKDKERNQEWIAWQQMRLTPEHFAFRGKEKLKRSRWRKNIVIWEGAFSAAAAIAILLTLLRFGPGTDSPDQLELTSSKQEAAEVSQAIKKAEGDHDHSPSGNEKPVPAEEPVIRTNGKHHNPREIASKDTNRATTLVAGNSISPEVIDRKLQPAPIKLAVRERSCLRVPESVACDRIQPLEVLHSTTRSQGQTRPRYTEMELSQATREFAREKNLSLLTMASAGISGINRLTGSDLALDVSRDVEGHATGFRFKSNWLSFSAPIENPE
jgi:hypothetical protein